MLRAAEDTSISVRTTPPTWLVVALACAGQFLVVLDVSVVNVALPSMRTDLGLSAPGLQWVVNAYAIAFAGFMLLGGRAGDLYGRKRMFLVGLALFTLASLGGGLAEDGWQLLVARAAQGLGAAVLAPSTLTILTSAVPEGAARARAIATWTAVGAGGGAAGGLVGGLLVDGLSWRWVLLINVPVGAIVLTGAAWWLVESRAGARRRLDLPGALLVTAGLATLAYGIVQTEAEGWAAAATLVPLVSGLVLIGLFLLVESRTKAPLMPLKLLRLRSVSSANAAMFLSGCAMFCMWFFMTLYLQNVLGYTPLGAGLALVPSSLAVVLGSKLAPRLMPVIGARNVAVLGTLVAAAGFGWQSTMTADGDTAGLARHLGRRRRGRRAGVGPDQHLADDGRLTRPGRHVDDRGGPYGGQRLGRGPHRRIRAGVPHQRCHPAGRHGGDAAVAAAEGLLELRLDRTTGSAADRQPSAVSRQPSAVSRQPSAAPRLSALGRRSSSSDVGQSQPCCRASRIASMRLRVPVLPIAEER
jgi:EmrB/QacA subfamily drug resistance transporter